MQTITLTDEQLQDLINGAQRAQADAQRAVRFAESALIEARTAQKSADAHMEFIKKLCIGS